MMKYTYRLFSTTFMGIILLILIGCAEKRPIKHVLPESHRMNKAFFTKDPFYVGITVTGASADTPVTHVGDDSFGSHSVVKFEMSEKILNVYAVDPRYGDQTSLGEPLISFPVEDHIDIEREKNADDEQTHREIETKTERPWKERNFAKINFAKGNLISSDLMKLRLYESFQCIKEVGSDLLDLNQSSDSLNLTLLKTYHSNISECSFSEESPKTFSVKIKISFLKKNKNPNFKPTLYDAKRLQKQVGIFSAVEKKYNDRNAPLEKEYAIHWDPSKKIVYYFSPDFPNKYKPLAHRVFENWNQVLKDPKVSGKPLLELKENSGQELGDIRYNFIVWINDPIQNAPGAYGPMRWDPFTGEIFNANAYIFAGNYKQTLQVIRDEMEKSSNAESKEGSSGSKGDTETLPKTLETSTTVNFKEDIVNSPFTLRAFFKKNQEKKTLSEALSLFEEGSGRCYYPTEIGDVSKWYAKGLSDDDIFQRLITDALVHELGHNLGLRHNFKGSVDKKHFISKENQTSSVMDYLDIEDSENGKPGPYDKEALTFAFTGEFNFHEKYLFCADENVMSDPFCNHFDRGTTASEIATYLSERYVRMYPRRNLRGRKLHFRSTREESREYRWHLLRLYYFPMREFMDYYLFVQNNGRTLEGDLLTDKSFPILSEDLLEAASISFNFFKNIVLNTEWAYRNVAHPYLSNDELMVRGTIIDKIMATEFLTIRDLPFQPWGGSKATYFDILELQNPVIHLIFTASQEPSFPSLILFFLAYNFINEVPIPGMSSHPFGRPSQQAQELFRIDKLPLTRETLAALENQKEAVSYLEDSIKQIIYVARKDAVLMLGPESHPMANLIETYNALYTEYQEFLKHKTQQEDGASEGDFTKTLDRIETLQKDLSSITDNDLDFLEKILMPKVLIVPSKKRLIKKFASKLSINDPVLIAIVSTILSKIKDSPEDLQKWKKILKTLYRQEKITEVLITKKELLETLQRFKLKSIRDVYALQKNLEVLRSRIDLFYMLYNSKGIHLE